MAVSLKLITLSAWPAIERERISVYESVLSEEMLDNQLNFKEGEK